MKIRSLFPSLRCRMGEWIYYVTFLKFSDISEWIKRTDEIHESQSLSEWIQRQIDRTHADNIASYLQHQPERFFNAIVVGVYGGRPEWASLKVSAPPGAGFDLLEEDEEELENSVGMLKFSGTESLFAIDGQHRVAGIKKALMKEKSLAREELCCIFVAHERTHEGIKRTRRLFTTLNKTAKKVSTSDIVALDEDDGFAVVTRRMVDECPFFAKGEWVAFATAATIPSNDVKSMTSVIGLYYITQDLYPRIVKRGIPKKTEILHSLPSDEFLQDLFQTNCDYWNYLMEFIPEYRQVMESKQVTPGSFRSKQNNHLLFRPIGQRAFAGATELLIHRNKSMKDAIEMLSKANLWLNHKDWHYLLWNPMQDKMIGSNQAVAETFLLRQVGEKGRTTKSDQRLDDIMKLRDQKQ